MLCQTFSKVGPGLNETQTNKLIEGDIRVVLKSAQSGIFLH